MNQTWPGLSTRLGECRHAFSRLDMSAHVGVVARHEPCGPIWSDGAYYVGRRMSGATKQISLRIRLPSTTLEAVQEFCRSNPSQDVNFQKWVWRS